MVGVSVGLKDNVPADTKAEIEKWLNARMANEFGKAGKGQVTLIKTIPPKKEEPKPEQKAEKKLDPPKTLLDYADQFQSLLGQIVLAVGLLFAALVWKILSAKSSVSLNRNGENSTIQMTGGAGGSAAGTGVSPSDAANVDSMSIEQHQVENQKLQEEIAQLHLKLNELAPKTEADLEAILRIWCQLGEPGKLRVAALAETLGNSMGRLPIPMDAVNDITRLFSEMAELPLSQKRDALQKAYWDLLTALNLGPNALSQPFGYLGGASSTAVNQVLMDQNPKMKTLVSLYLPKELRTNFMKSLSIEKKRELLLEAAQLNEISKADLGAFDTSLRTKLSGAKKLDVVSLNMTLKKLVESLTRVEEITLLADMSGPAIQTLKQTSPTLAFVAQWPDEKLSLLLSRATSDELVSLARTLPELQERLLKLSPPLTAEMASDELRAVDKISVNDKNAWLNSLTQRLTELVSSKDIQLEEVFADKESDVGAVSDAQAA